MIGTVKDTKKNRSFRYAVVVRGSEGTCGSDFRLQGIWRQKKPARYNSEKTVGARKS